MSSRRLCLGYRDDAPHAAVAVSDIRVGRRPRTGAGLAERRRERQPTEEEACPSANVTATLAAERTRPVRHAIHMLRVHGYPEPEQVRTLLAVPHCRRPRLPAPA